MEIELLHRCNELDDAHHDAMSRADVRRQKMWSAAYMIRDNHMPHMATESVEILTELAFLSILPAYQNITRTLYSTSLQTLPSDYKEYFSNLVHLARRLDTHGSEDLATDEDWRAWMDAM